MQKKMKQKQAHFTEKVEWAFFLVTHNISDFDCIKEKSFLKVEDWFV